MNLGKNYIDVVGDWKQPTWNNCYGNDEQLRKENLERNSVIMKSRDMQGRKKVKRRKNHVIEKNKKRSKTRQDKVNNAFAELREILPTYPPDKKLSKCQILRVAVRYIKLLEKVLDISYKEDATITYQQSKT